MPDDKDQVWSGFGDGPVAKIHVVTGWGSRIEARQERRQEGTLHNGSREHVVSSGRNPASYPVVCPL